MPKLVKIISPDYNSFYIAGRDGVEIPIDHTAIDGIGATDDCINVGCLYYNDGDTTVEMGSFAEIGEASSPHFDTILQTPDRLVLVFETNPPEIMRASVPDTTTRIRIWTNHRREPDHVKIALG